jgi:hypothetical protein
VRVERRALGALVVSIWRGWGSHEPSLSVEWAAWAAPVRFTVTALAEKGGLLVRSILSCFCPSLLGHRSLTMTVLRVLRAARTVVAVAALAEVSAAAAVVVVGSSVSDLTSHRFRPVKWRRGCGGAVVLEATRRIGRPAYRGAVVQIGARRLRL